MLFNETEVCNFADDITIIVMLIKLAIIKSSSSINSVLANPGNIQLILFGSKIDNRRITFIIGK